MRSRQAEQEAGVDERISAITVIETQDATNEELQSANEEILSSKRELQSIERGN